MLTNGGYPVKLLLSFDQFDGAYAVIFTTSGGGTSEAYYQLYSLNGCIVDLEIWVDQLIFLQQIELPLKIYGKAL